MLNPGTYPQEPTQFGLHRLGIVDTVRTVPGVGTIALTFDACNGEVDASLLDTLREHHIPATLFLAQPWAEAHPNVARRLIGNPLFMIGNHGTRHPPLAVRGSRPGCVRDSRDSQPRRGHCRGGGQRPPAAGIGRVPGVVLGGHGALRQRGGAHC